MKIHEVNLILFGMSVAFLITSLILGMFSTAIVNAAVVVLAGTMHCLGRDQ